MARTRLLHPSFFTDEVALSMPPLCRLLFQGLWCLADREGRLEDKPVEIRIKVLPMDEGDVNAMLNVIANKGLIRRYSVDGRRFICIPRFTKYQKPHQREAPSAIPPSTEPLVSLGNGEAQPRHDPGTALAMASRAVSVSVSESVAVSKSGVFPATPAPAAVRPQVGHPTQEPGGLRQSLEATFRKQRGTEYAWRTADDNACRELLGLANGDWAEIDRRFAISLRRVGFPRSNGTVDLVKFWNAYATDEPKPAARGRAAESDKYRSGVPLEEEPF